MSKGLYKFKSPLKTKSFRRPTNFLLRESSRVRIAALCVLVFILGIATGQFQTLLWVTRRSIDSVQRTGRYYAGRTEVLDPSPKCCYAEDCLASDQGRHAVITSLRTNRYLPLVQELACSLKRTNPDLPLVVYTVRGDLTPAVEDAVRLFAELKYWEKDLRFPSYQKDGRFSLNWVKLRAWELTQYDAVLLVDSDITFLGNVSTVFSLPTPFAAVPDQDELAPALWFSSLGRVQGGFLFLRPCQAVAEHMQAIVIRNSLLQFQYEYAEQDFLDWYFKFDRWLLPLEYNSVLPLSNGNHTPGGNTAKAIHFTKHKPFGGRDATVPQHRYLTCTSSGRLATEQEARSAAAAAAAADQYYTRRMAAGAGRAAAGAKAALDVVLSQQDEKMEAARQAMLQRQQVAQQQRQQHAATLLASLVAGDNDEGSAPDGMGSGLGGVAAVATTAGAVSAVAVEVPARQQGSVARAKQQLQQQRAGASSTAEGRLKLTVAADASSGGGGGDPSSGDAMALVAQQGAQQASSTDAPGRQRQQPQLAVGAKQQAAASA